MRKLHDVLRREENQADGLLNRGVKTKECPGYRCTDNGQTKVDGPLSLMNDGDHNGKKQRNGVVVVVVVVGSFAAFGDCGVAIDEVSSQSP